MTYEAILAYLALAHGWEPNNDDGRWDELNQIGPDLKWHIAPRDEEKEECMRLHQDPRRGWVIFARGHASSQGALAGWSYGWSEEDFTRSKYAIVAYGC